jgi:hypothetical protein
LDLEALLDGWHYFGWGPERLCEYLDTRPKLHGGIWASDELEIAGFFIKHGGLHWLLGGEWDRTCLTPDYSDVFDEIWSARRGGPKLVYSPTKPFVRDIRKMLAGAMQEGKEAAAQRKQPMARKKQGRNEPCACGSGKKYKYCCGRGP